LATDPPDGSPVNDTDIVTSSYFGNSVSTAGDVNGDGFADVIVGAPLSTTLASSEAGAAYVFLGSASGPQVPAVWVQTGDLHSGFGGSVANAGDLNGDGFADVLVGAPNDNAYGTGVGAAFIKPGAVVVDVGIHALTEEAPVRRLFGDDEAKLRTLREKGSVLCGDVHPREGAARAGWLSPVPGGVGPMTIAMLLANTLEAARRCSASD
jgi:hypothetical protein